MQPLQGKSPLGWVLKRAGATIGAVAMTAGCFLVLPVIQAIASDTRPDLVLQSVDSAVLPPPPTPPAQEEEPEPEKQEEEPPPELESDAPPPDLSMLEMPVSFGAGGTWSGPDLSMDLGAGGNGDDVDALFSMSDLDQEPRVIYQAPPVIGAKERKQTPGSVWVLLVIDEQGHVQNPRVQQSSHPVLEGPTLKAVQKWRFEPGKRNGKAVSFRRRVQISFPKSN